MSIHNGYSADARRYDELLDDTGALRPHWKTLFDRLGTHFGADVSRRGIELTRQLIKANGVTYNVYADSTGTDRPWALDPLPLMMSAEEWRHIERGVAQRARALDALLADLYGQQRLIAEGLVPPELPFGHPNFLWPALGVVPPGGSWLHIYAVDLARAPDGRWWVLADRTQCPSGAGYALENREIIEQVLPDPIRELDVRKLRGFFAALRFNLLKHVDPGEDPLAVVLTPGPFNETYFEHAYLARELGVTLAEGTDLTVRDDTVYLKTLAGPKRVHAILRRLDDDFCDPLELRSDSALGVPGLLGAVRAGRIVLANALGSGVLESAAWLGFHPGIARRLLGEDLALPSVATWWCGEASALEFVLSNLDDLVVKPAYPNQRFEPVFGRALVGRAREALITRLRTRPYAYVAQEHLALSQAPVLGGDGGSDFTAKAVTIRVYAFATAAGLMVLPGGLARVAADASINAVTTQDGGASKDIWVLPDPEQAVPQPPPVAAARVSTRTDLMPSRLVENLYWMGRYAVRCEDKAGLLRATLAAPMESELRRNAVRMCRDLFVIRADTDPSAALDDEDDPHGLMADIRRLGWCASQVRGRLPGLCWQTVSSLQQQLRTGVRVGAPPHQTLDGLLVSLAALAQFTGNEVTPDAGWRLLRIGRRLERLQFMARLLSQHLAQEHAQQHGNVQWLLSVCDGVAAPRLGAMLELLMRDAQYPRGLAFQWQGIRGDMHELSKILRLQIGDAPDEPIPALTDSQLTALEDEGPAAAAARLHLAAGLQKVATATNRFSDRLSMRQFSHAGLDSQALAT
ncbi:MAG TPA: circularly permuted type 2 ATP-grasp protein [Steroidobacteraceae bacterium]